MILCDNGFTKVQLVVIKTGTSRLIRNEIEGLTRMQKYAPEFKVIPEGVQIDYIEDQKINFPQEYINQYFDIIKLLKKQNIVHSDLTDVNIRVSNDKVYILDFAESIIDNMGKVKRPEGDKYWLMRTMLNKVYKTVNTRADDMFWLVYNEIIEKFKDNKVEITDYGFGYGDLLLKFWILGYGMQGVEKDKEKIDRLNEINNNLILINDDIEKVDCKSHIAFCFSVLPYLKDQKKFLKKLIKNHSCLFIESQYKGDGPGIYTYDEFINMLLEVGLKVRKIGFTEVKERKAIRDIFYCER